MLIQVTGLSFSYRVRQVLKHIDWRWNKNQQWAVLGPNGAGKTTLAKALTRQISPSAGKIELGETVLKKSMAYVCFEQQKALCNHDRRFDDSEFQSSAFDIGTTVKQAILGRSEESNIFNHWVERLGITHILERGIRYISTGEMRKTLLLRALLSDPGLIILDNPLDGLDRASQQELLDILTDLLDSEIALLILCRQIEDIPSGISHVLVLDQGEVVASGNTEQIVNDPILVELLCPELPPLTELPPPAERPYQLDKKQPLLELHNVSVRYHQNRVLDDVNWTLNTGQHCSISGPNGCGKSTLLSLINGENHKAYGQNIWLFGQRRGSGESVWDIKQKFGVIDTRLQLNHVRGMKAIEVVVSGLFDTIGLYDDWGEQQLNTAQHWMAALGIGGFEASPYDELSFGLQRMVLLARAMVKSPAILILDEPCLGLDSFHRRLLLRAVDHIAANSDTQILFVSHTTGDTPGCINQFLEFKAEDGAYQLECTNLA